MEPVSPLPFTGGVGGGHDWRDFSYPPLAPPAGGRGIDGVHPAGGRGAGRASHAGAKPIKNKRAIARQATSAVAFEYEPPSPDDPLLAFIPVPHKQPQRNSITPDLQRAFIAHLAATGIVTSAARESQRQLVDFGELLDYMVRNKLAGRAYVHGLDLKKGIAENAELLRQRAQDSE